MKSKMAYKQMAIILGCITFTEISEEKECTQCLSFDKITPECKASIGNISIKTFGYSRFFLVFSK